MSTHYGSGPVTPSWGQPYGKYNPADPRWQAIEAFLRRNIPSTITWEVRRVRMFGVPGFGLPPVQEHFVFTRQGDMEMWAQADYLYDRPDATLTDLERELKFGNPNIQEEIFRMPEVLPPPVSIVPIINAVGQPIQNTTPQAYEVAAGWNEGATSGDEYVAQDGTKYILKQRFYFGGTRQRWWVKAS